jgi:hypothetical protein
MVLGVSTRRYARSLEALPHEFEVRGTGKSAVSERFVVGTQRRLSELLRRDLTGLALVAVMIDGVHFADHVVLARSASSATAKSTYWGCAKARPRMPRPARRFWLT